MQKASNDSLGRLKVFLGQEICLSNFCNKIVNFPRYTFEIQQNPRSKV